MKTHQTTKGKTQEWLTPTSILNKLGDFDLDPASPVIRPWPTAREHYTIDDDGLSKDWHGRVWLNPPFDRCQRPKWMKKMSEHGNGIMLVPAACETQAFYHYVYGKSDGILMLKSRPHFCYPNGARAKANSGCTICLVAYGKSNLSALIDSGLGQVMVTI